MLFDEVEKAHRDVNNVLLQVFDDGRLTDSQGYVVDFKNSVIILTSNLGSEVLSSLPEGADTSSNEVREAIMEHVRAHFSPEFINRLDDVVMFDRLSRDAMADIVDVQLTDGASPCDGCFPAPLVGDCLATSVANMCVWVLPVAARVWLCVCGLGVGCIRWCAQWSRC